MLNLNNQSLSRNSMHGIRARERSRNGSIIWYLSTFSRSFISKSQNQQFTRSTSLFFFLHCVLNSLWSTFFYLSWYEWIYYSRYICSRPVIKLLSLFYLFYEHQVVAQNRAQALKILSTVYYKRKRCLIGFIKVIYSYLHVHIWSISIFNKLGTYFKHMEISRNLIDLKLDIRRIIY